MQAVMLILMMNVDSLSNPHVSVPEYVYFSQASNITHRFDPLSLQVHPHPEPTKVNFHFIKYPRF